MRGKSSFEVDEVRESEPSSERTWPPRAEEMSCTTAPREDSETKIVAFMTGSISAGWDADMEERRLAFMAARDAMERAVGVVSGKRCVEASRSMWTWVLATGKPLKGPRARAADAPACN